MRSPNPFLRIAPVVAVLPILVCPVAAQETADDPRPTVVVLSVDVVGDEHDEVRAQHAAVQLRDDLNHALARDTTIRALPLEPAERPRNPRTGRTVIARHVLLAYVASTREGTIRVRWTLIALENVEIIAVGGMALQPGLEYASAYSIAEGVSSALRSRVEHGPGFQEDYPPFDIVTILGDLRDIFDDILEGRTADARSRAQAIWDMAGLPDSVRAQAAGLMAQSYFEEDRYAQSCPWFRRANDLFPADTAYITHMKLLGCSP